MRYLKIHCERLGADEDLRLVPCGGIMGVAGRGSLNVASWLQDIIRIRPRQKAAPLTPGSVSGTSASVPYPGRGSSTAGVKSIPKQAGTKSSWSTAPLRSPTQVRIN